MASGRYDLRVEDQPDPRDVRALEDGLYAFNVQQTGRDDGRGLAVFLRDADGRLVGGLSGWTWAGWLKVNLLWVREDRRGHGHGRALLAAAETEARARGCARATLDTYSFQAPEFYRKLGWRVVADVEDFPAPGQSHYTLIKEL
jgi:GNAT superfamily N-acetyltransferase